MTEQQHHREVDQTERELESGRPGAGRRERGEEDLRQRWVDRLQIGVVDPRPGRVAQRRQLRVVGRVGIGVNARPLHAAVPDVTMHVVGQRRGTHGGDQAEQERRAESPTQRPRPSGDRPQGQPHRQREQAVDGQEQRQVLAQIAQRGQRDVERARRNGERQDPAGNSAPTGGVLGIRTIHGRARVTVGAA
jgi:hypothetical protein